MNRASHWALVYPNEGEGGEVVIDGRYAKTPALNLGCGRLVLPGFVNFDHHDGIGVDVVADFETTPLTETFPRNHFKFVLARHVMEHVPHRVSRVEGEFWFTLINELMAITENGGYWDVRSPCNFEALRAPGHTRLIGPGSWWPWERDALTMSNEQPDGTEGYLKVVSKKNVRNWNVADPSRFGRAMQYHFIIQVQKP